MSIEHELPHLLEELAKDHVVGEPPAFESHNTKWSEQDRARPARFTIAAVAACSAVLIGGLVAISSLNDDPAPAASPSTTSETSKSSSSEPSTSTTDIAGPQSLDLIRIEAQSSSEGTTRVVLMFDGDLPKSDPVPVDNVASPPSDRVGYATQTSLDSPVSVCEDTHWFPPPGNRIVDVFVPSDWFDQAASIDPPTSWSPDGAPPSKIIVCEPLNATVQISIWGSASGRMEDLRVSMDERMIIVDIAPDSTDLSADTVEVEPIPTPSVNPVTRPLVAIDGNGDAVYFAADETTPVLIFDGPDLDDASSLGDGPNAVDRVAYGAGQNRFILSRCCAPAVGQIVTAGPDELPMPSDIAPPKDQVGEAQLVFDGFGYAPAIDPNGDRQVSIVGDGRGIFVIDAATDTFANLRLPDESGDLWDLLWNESGILIIGRTESTWTLTTADYSQGRIDLGPTRNFATLSDFEDLRFAGAALEDEIAVHDLRTDTVLSGTIDDYGNNNGDERGSSLQVITLPGAALSAWFYDPGQPIWVDMDRTLRVGDRVIPGEFTWARR